MFEERLAYKQASFSYPYDPVPLDMIYEKPFYGKVDIYGNTVYPSEVNMVQLPGSGLLLVHDFVAKAFNRLKEVVDLHITSRERRFADIFSGGFVPKAATRNFHKLYQEHFVENVYNVFTNDYILNTPENNRNVKKFSDYVKQFVDFSEFMQDQFPITKTGFIMSTMCPNAISGLIIEVESAPMSDDALKYENFISKPSFAEYLKVASGFGFYVDKHCPWRLAVNMDHWYMNQAFMAAFGTTLKDNIVFKDYFYRAEYYSYEDFKARMWNGYQMLISSPDTVSYGLVPQVKNCIKTTWGDVASNTYNTVYTEGLREPLSDEYDGKFQLDYPDSFFLPHYFKIRTSESELNYDDKDFRAKLKKILNINKIRGVHEAINLIEKYTKQSKIYVKNAKNENYPSRIKYFGNSVNSGLHSYEEPDKVLSDVEVQEAEYQMYTGAEEEDFENWSGP